MKKIYVLFVLILSLGSFLFGCGANEESAKSNASAKLKIYTTIFPLEDFAKKIGGDHVEVVSVFPPGVDAHTFEPTAKTMVDIAKADGFIYSGAGIEGFVEAAIDALKNENVKMVKAAEGIELVSLGDHAHDDNDSESESGHDDHAHDDNGSESESGHDDHAHDEHDSTGQEEGHDSHNHGDLDPHVWLDPTLALQLADTILHALEELKPEAKEEFEENFDTLKQQLEELDQKFKEAVEHAPKKEILVAHAAYGYWETRYGIEQISVTGLSPTNEPSQKDLRTIIETAKNHNIKYVIFEQNVSTKVAEIVRNEINAEALTLHNLEALSDENVKNSEDYFSLMERNIETLKIALSQ
ncbi:metal ABC transporter solute-binding protein, Zn/Mn family [Bacillus salitolerans]|uniref:Metal ABC transporter solute-binding protein, Zn/Mn family n=1 Tax=Bacillus salitolerans TaxID=1437434 RepID=A0ABW4LVI5_9BACI